MSSTSSLVGAGLGLAAAAAAAAAAVSFLVGFFPVAALCRVLRVARVAVAVFLVEAGGRVLLGVDVLGVSVMVGVALVLPASDPRSETP